MRAPATPPRLLPVLALHAARAPGLYRVALLHCPQGQPDRAPTVAAWLLRDGSFALPRTPKDCARIAEHPRRLAERHLERAASLLRALPG